MVAIAKAKKTPRVLIMRQQPSDRFGPGAVFRENIGRFGPYASPSAACARVRLPGSPPGEEPEEPTLDSADRLRSPESISGSFVPAVCRYLRPSPHRKFSR